MAGIGAGGLCRARSGERAVFRAAACGKLAWIVDGDCDGSDYCCDGHLRHAGNALLAYTGHVQTSLAWPSIVALDAALVGMGLGQLTRGKIKAETFRLCFFVGLMLLGAHLALRGLL